MYYIPPGVVEEGLLVYNSSPGEVEEGLLASHDQVSYELTL